jgi:hypothetical protein
MTDAMTNVALASMGLLAVSIPTMAALRGWQGWLELRKTELAGAARIESRSPAGDMIEVADLKERVRKLEAIAAVVDL